jgi:tetratricopeptide (TPR) repeat protein
MKSILVASVALALALPASAQQFSDTSKTVTPVTPQAAALTVQNSTREAALERAALDMIHKDYAAAEVVYRGLIKESPNDPTLWNHVGIAQQQQDKFGDALKSYQHAAKLDKKGGEAWNNMGTVYFEQLKWVKAVRTYQKAIDLDPYNATFYSNMGLAYLKHKQVPEAIKAFQHALALDPDVFERRGRVGAVIQHKSADNYGQLYFLLAKSFASAGNADRCGYYLRKARDEGYTGIDSAKTDPAFSGVLNDATIRTILGLPELPADAPKKDGIG